MNEHEVAQNALVFVATRDMEVAVGLLDKFRPYHFNDPFMGAEQSDRFRIETGLDYGSNWHSLSPRTGDAPRAPGPAVR